MIKTFGAFSRNPLYNELQVRKNVPVSASVRLLYTRQELKEKSVQELSDGLDEAFSFDHFRWQKEQQLHIREDFRADGLERILYKCACCGREGFMKGSGTVLTCGSCNKSWELTTLGQLQAIDGSTKFSHIPHWYAWQRNEVAKELVDGSYKLDTPVDIAMLVDFKAI